MARLTETESIRVRLLVHSRASASRWLNPDLDVDVIVGSITDEEILTTALGGIHTVFHLVGTETRGRHSKLSDVDVEGTKKLVSLAQEARVGRIIYVSRVGADRASAYPVRRAKGEAEEVIISSGIAYTIFRVSVLFGIGDRFSEHIAMLARAFPFYTVPGEGDTVLQPLWIGDLVTCLAMSLEDLDSVDRIMAIGGPELLTYRRIVMRVMHACSSRRPIIGLPLLVHRAGSWFLDGLFARWPFTEQWVEMLSSSQAAELGYIERSFGFRPAAFDIGLIDTYMRNRPYFFNLICYIFTRHW